MKAHEALIAWTPEDEADDHAGMIRVGPLIDDHDRDWTDPFSQTAGAAYVKRRDLRGLESITRLFVDFHDLVLHDGMDPKEVHEAFLAIDEYRQVLGLEGLPPPWSPELDCAPDEERAAAARAWGDDEPFGPAGNGYTPTEAEIQQGNEDAQAARAELAERGER